MTTIPTTDPPATDPPGIGSAAAASTIDNLVTSDETGTDSQGLTNTDDPDGVVADAAIDPEDAAI
jgi:hypothetical protein